MYQPPTMMNKLTIFNHCIWSYREVLSFPKPYVVSFAQESGVWQRSNMQSLCWGSQPRKALAREDFPDPAAPTMTILGLGRSGTLHCTALHSAHFGKIYDKQEQRCCSHGDETNTTAEGKLIIEEGFARLNVHIETYHKYISAPAQVHLCKRGWWNLYQN